MTRPQIVLAGNPNVGKTTLFNALTGLSAKVSNYPGITVERRDGSLTLPGGRTADVHDIPGTYSLNARSAEEQIALDALAGLGGERAPDAVIVCLDATQLARSAYLLLQVPELGARCVAANTGRHQQAQGPDGAAMGIYPAGDGQHRRFAFTCTAPGHFALGFQIRDAPPYADVPGTVYNRDYGLRVRCSTPYTGLWGRVTARGWPVAIAFTYSAVCTRRSCSSGPGPTRSST